MQEQEIVALLKKLISSEKSVGFMQLCDDYLKIYARKQKKSVGKDMRYIVDVTIHDLRRTCATWMFSDGESLDTIRELLNHSSTKTTKIYAKLKRDKIAGAMERLSNKVSQFAPAPKN